jgi:hypothetical protein
MNYSVKLKGKLLASLNMCDDASLEDKKAALRAIVSAVLCRDYKLVDVEAEVPYN